MPMPASDRTRARAWHRWLMAAGVMLIVAAFALLGLSFSGLVGEDAGSIPAPTAAPALSDASTSTGFSLDLDEERLRRLAEGLLTPEVTPEAAPPDGDGPAVAPPVVVAPARLVIPKIQVEAPVVTVGVDGNGVMESPKGPFEVGWYSFTAAPGSGGNAVFSGHVDYVNVGAAVFWGLRNLGAGDLVEVRLADGTAYTYVVVSSMSYDANDVPITEIVGPTARDTVTLITCTGTFNRDVRQYSHRLVVRAERL